MSELTAQMMAEDHSAKAREMYERDNYVFPAVALYDGMGAGPMLMPQRNSFDGDVPTQLATLVMLTGEFVKARYVVVIVEAWMKAYDAKEYREHNEEPHLERGQLQRESDTDASIHTVIMVCAHDLVNPDNTHSIMNEVTGNPLKIKWQIKPMTGKPIGRLADVILGAYHGSKMLRGNPIAAPIKGDTLHERLQWIAEHGHLAAAMVTEVSTQPERNN